MSWLDKYSDETPKAQNGIEGTMGGLTDKGFDYNGAWGGQFQDGGLLNSRQKRGNELLMKELKKEQKDKKELYSKGTIKNPKSIFYKKQKQDLQRKQTFVEQDDRTEYVRKLDEEKGKAIEAKKQFKKNVIAPLDFVTDLMQVGNFIPHPAAQSVAKLGNIGGAAIDAWQAADDLSEENYTGAAINAASVLLPAALNAKTFRRNSKYLQPGQPLYPFSPQANLPANATISQRLNIPNEKYIEPFTKVRGMTDANLLANRSLLGTLGAETVYDIPEFQGGGNIPGAVGFTYARTQGIPSEGPYAKKTMPSAQNGQEMKYYQEGLDWKPKTISRNGAWLDGHDVAQTGTEVLANKEKALQMLADIQKRKQGKSKPSTEFSNVKIKNERKEAVTKADNTRSKSKLKVTDVNKLNVRNKTEQELAEQERLSDEAIAAERRAIRERSDANPLNQGFSGFFNSENQTRQNWEDSAAGLESKFRVSDKPNFFDDYLNPLSAIGGMAADLGAAPNQIVQQDSMAPLIGAIATPLLTGAIEGIGAKSNKQFVNNLVNPFNIVPGYKSAEKYVSNRLGNVRTNIASKLKQGLRTADPSSAPAASISSDLRRAFDNFDPRNLKSESGLDWMKQWYSDPDFIRRYSSTGQYGAYPMQEHILKQLDKYQPKNYIDLLKDKGVKKYIEHSAMSGGVSWGVPENIYINRTMYGPFNKKGLESVRTHELTHLIEGNGQHLGPIDEQELLLKPFHIPNVGEIPKGKGFFRKYFLGDNPEYFLDPTEIHARMNQARFDLGLTPKDEFTEQMFDKISKEKGWYGMDKYIKDKKGMVDLMNNFWAVTPAVIGTGALYQNNQQEEFPQYKKGGIIKDDRGQWAHPGEITEINSNDITMEGVPYPVLGISDEGDTKLMKPGKNYKFKGKKVTEFPMAKNGINDLDAKPLQKLDNLLNFTNYNTDQSGGWLDKFQKGGDILDTSSSYVRSLRSAEMQGPQEEVIEDYDRIAALPATNTGIAKDIPIPIDGAYVVQKGDTLSKIAKESGVSVNNLAKVNKIKDVDQIKVNQKLLLPAVTQTKPLPEKYQNWDVIKKKTNILNKLSDLSKIVSYHKSTPDEIYSIVDKKNSKLLVYQGDKLIKSFEVGTGQNPGDAQTVTKIVNGKTDWDSGNKSTGAGIYTVSNVDPSSDAYYGLPSFNLKNEQGIEVATSIHGTPKQRRKYFNNNTLSDNRMSNGCINGQCKDLPEMYNYLTEGTKVYILPEDKGNSFEIVDGKPVFRVDPKNSKKYETYIDKKGIKQKGQGVNRTTNTLVYKPIRPVFNEEKFKDDVFTTFDFNDEKEYNKTTKPFIKGLTENKKAIMQAAQIPSDVYNELAKMAFGIYGTESNYGDTHSAVGNLSRAAVKFISPSNSSSPDYEAKATTYGADEDTRSVGLTQIRWSYLNKKEKEVLKKLGITSNKDFLDPKKAAIGTTAVLGVRYNEQLTSDQKKDIWKNLPTKWNKRENYPARVKSNSSYLNFEQLD